MPHASTTRRAMGEASVLKGPTSVGSGIPKTHVGDGGCASSSKYIGDEVAAEHFRETMVRHPAAMTSSCPLGQVFLATRPSFADGLDRAALERHLERILEDAHATWSTVPQPVEEFALFKQKLFNEWNY